MTVVWTGFDWQLFLISEGFAMLIFVAIVQAANISRNSEWWSWITQNVYPFFKPPPLFDAITAPILVLSTGAVFYLYGRLYFIDRGLNLAVDPALNLDYYTAVMSLLFANCVLVVLRFWLVNGYGQMGPAWLVNCLAALAAINNVWMMWWSATFLPAIVYIPYAVWNTYKATCDFAVWLATPPGPAPAILWHNEIDIPLGTPLGGTIQLSKADAAAPRTRMLISNQVGRVVAENVQPVYNNAAAAQTRRVSFTPGNALTNVLYKNN